VKKDIHVICKGKDHYIYKEIDILHRIIFKRKKIKRYMDHKRGLKKNIKKNIVAF
jgi:hypothetical protein